MTGYTRNDGTDELGEAEMVSADQADKAIAEAVKKALAETDDSETDTDEVETERSL
jgi:hypothetical protein